MTPEASGCGAVRKGFAGEGTCDDRSAAGHGAGPRRRPPGFYFKPRSSEHSKNGVLVTRTARRLCPPPHGGERSPAARPPAFAPGLQAETHRPLATSRLAPSALEAGGRGVARDVTFRFDSPPPSQPIYKTSPGVHTRTSGPRRRAREVGGGEEFEGRGRLGRVSAPRRWWPVVLGDEATMELLRTITYQPAASTKMCEQALGKACGGDSKKKRLQPPPEEPQPPQPPAQVQPAAPHHHHHHSHSGAEISRIIVDPTTGKRYCRGKVLGKVTSGGRPAARREGGLPGRFPHSPPPTPGPGRTRSPSSPAVSRGLRSRIPARRGGAHLPSFGFCALVVRGSRSPSLPAALSASPTSPKTLILRPESRVFYT